MPNFSEVFSEIYTSRKWGIFPWTPSSGTGSSVVNTKVYRKVLLDLLDQLHINSVVDYGCGDWTFSSCINWDKINYTGVDVVESIIQENIKLYSNSTIKFICTDKFSELPSGDLLIIKDVLQHWPLQYIIKFLDTIRTSNKFKYCLITNCSTSEFNTDIFMGEFRKLNFLEYPLNKYQVEHVISSNGKSTYLLNLTKFNLDLPNYQDWSEDYELCSII